MEQAYQVVPLGNEPHVFHGQQVLIHRHVGGGVDGCQLVLSGSGLVVLGLGVDAQLPELLVQLAHEGGNLGLDGAKVVILHLLPLGSGRTEQSAAAVDEILSLLKILPVDQEILLFSSHRGGDTGGGSITEQTEYTQRLHTDGVHGAAQGGLGVQRLTGVGAEGGGDVQGAVLNEGVGGGIPGRVTACFKGGTQTARGERGAVGLALNELLTREFHHHAITRDGGNEGVVLLGGHAGQGLEPVGVVGGTLLNSPVLHGVGYYVGNGGIDGAPLFDGLGQSLVDLAGQPGAHDVVVEDHAAKELGNLFGGHKVYPFCAYND